MNTIIRHSCASSQTHKTPDFTGTREQVWYLINRAYQNIYGMNMPAEWEYQHTIYSAAFQMYNDSRVRGMSEKQMLKAFEDVIRICDAHHREAQQHISRATNPVYLREMALDNAMEQQKYMTAVNELLPKSHVKSMRIEHTGRVYGTRESDQPTASVMDAAYQQLAFTLDKKSQ